MSTKKVETDNNIARNTSPRIFFTPDHATIHILDMLFPKWIFDKGF